MSLVSAAFLEHLRTNNSAGLEAVWSRAPSAERPALVAALHEQEAIGEAHVFLRALVDRTRPAAEQERLVRLGIDALSDLASRRSSDRISRLAQWARAGEVREALLATAAQRGPAVSDELVEWLVSSDDDALTDALIPVFLGAVDARDGARLELLSTLAVRVRRLSVVGERYDALMAQSRAEWRAFVTALGLEREPPFAVTCAFRAAEPAISLTVNPVKLNWYSLTWGEQVCDSTRRAVAGFPIDSTRPLVELPSLILAAMKAGGLRGRRTVHTGRGTSEATEARLQVWLSGAGEVSARAS